jgi:hypothetical protein
MVVRPTTFVGGTEGPLFNLEDLLCTSINPPARGALFIFYLP